VLYTGDQGAIDADGLLTFCGRSDRQLKSMGIRLSPDEVEAALHRSGLVREVAAYGAKHDILGHEVRVAIAANEGVTPADVTRWARANLPAHMVPRKVRLVDALPRTHTGKVVYPAVERG
jgi:acyl-coenzyme A synthetase/AMP-(fatty) acid ligase